MGLDLNTALISDTFDGLIKTQDGNALTASPLPIGDGRGNDSSLALATAGNGVTITGTLLVDGANIGSGLATAQSDITAIEAKTDFITVTGAINLDTIKTKADFITVTQAVDLDTIESDIAVATAKTDYITVTQAVNLDTMESDILSAKTKTDFISITQSVNLDTVESGLATAQSDITAIEAKTDYITISSALNLNTVASNASAAKTKTDFLTVTQAVDLDTLESDVNVAKGDITAIEAKTDNITVTQAVNLDTMESDIADAKTKTDFLTVTQAVNLDTVESGLSQAQTDINQIEGKTDFITVTQAVNLDTMESDIATNNAKNSYPAGDATKVGFISVTQAVDLDSMETDISNLSSNKYDKTGGTISGNVTVTGDLTVNGTTITVNTETLSVKDPLIELANQNSANSVDTGFYANYSLDAGVTTKYAGLFKDAGDSDKFKLFKGLEVEPTTTVDTAGTGYTKGDLVVGALEADTVSGVLANGVTATTQSAGDNSTKVATTAYVDAIVTAQDLDFAGGTGTGSVDLDSQTFTIAGTTNEIETSASGQTITIGLPSSVTVGTLTATTLGGTLSTAAQPNITSVGTLSSLTVSGALNATISTAAQPNITSVGTLSSLAVSSSASEIANFTGSNTASALTIDNTNVNDWGSNLAFKSNGTAAGYVGTIGSLIGSTDKDITLWGTSGNGVRFYTNGNNERMRIDASGSVLIGKSSSNNNPLQVSNGSNMLDFLWDANGAYLVSANNAGTVYKGFQYDASEHKFFVSASEKMRIDSSGNIGVGTSSPDTIINAAAADNTILRLESTDTSPSINQKLGGVEFYGNGSTLGAGVYGSLNGFYEDTAGRSYLTLSTRTSTGLFERLRIDSSGNVGVGTSSPSSFNGAANQLVVGTNSGNNGITIAAATTGFGSIYFADGTTGNEAYRGYFEYNHSADYLVLGTAASERMRITSGGDVLIGTTTNSLGAHLINKSVAAPDSIFGLISNTTGRFTAVFSACDASGENAANTAMKIAKNASTGRSINAGGTINASGADYAEYMYKSTEDNISKGDVVGIDSNGLLTNVFADAVSFAVKSTNPSYVGGDVWGNEDVIGKKPEKTEEQTEEEFAVVLAEFEAKLEAERAKVDRIAFSGQVPCNVYGASVGDYIIPTNDNGKISGKAVSNPSFDEYKLSVGKVWKIMEDGRAWIAVKIG